MRHFLTQFEAQDYLWVFPGGSPTIENFVSPDGMMEVSITHGLNSNFDYSVWIKELNSPSMFLKDAEEIKLKRR